MRTALTILLLIGLLPAFGQEAPSNGHPHPAVPMVPIDEGLESRDLDRQPQTLARVSGPTRPAGYSAEGLDVSLAAMLGFDDAVSREFSVWQRPVESSFTDAVSREFSVWQRPVESSFTDAVSREFSVWQRPVESSFTDAVSREFSVWQRPVESIINDAVSREFSVYTSAGAGIMYVKGDTGNDANDGSSWALAKKTLQAAFDAGVEGTEYWVARGAYTSNPLLKLVRSGSIYGGFAGTESAKSERIPGANITTISGGNLDRALTVNITGSLTLDSLTISNGVPPNGFGGGVYFGGKGLVIENCTFTSNSAGVNFGGGLFHEGTSLHVSNSTFRSNSAFRGGGVYVKTGTAVLQGCVFSENKATAVGSGYAAALYLASPGEALVNRCWFNDNVGDRGGTVDVFPENTPVTIANSVFLRNAGDRGSAVLNSSGTVAVLNCSFLDNSAAGPAVKMETVNNNVVANNIFYRNGGGLQMPTGTVAGNCMFGNTLFDYAEMGDQTGLNGNIKADPKFVAGYTARIRPNSPCRNAGVNGFTVGLDIDGQNRIEGGTIDIGADESYGEYVGRVIYIRTDGNDSSSGLSWGSAKKTLSGALAAAATGDEVWIAKGTYTEQNLIITVGVSIYGGFVGNETDRNQANPALNVTAFDGKNTDRILRMADLPLSLTLNGLTFKNGFRTTGAAGIFLRGGAGNASNFTIQRCTFLHNKSAYNSNWGGGAMWIQSARVSVTDCTFSGNEAGSGGGIALVSNESSHVARCVFDSNRALYSGGFGSAIAVQATLNTTIEQCLFSGNEIVNGGTLGVLFGSTPTTVRNSVFASNKGPYGSAIWGDAARCNIVNNTITGGNAAQAVLLPNPGGTHFVNNIITQTNGGLEVANGTLAVIKNTCVWQNGAFDYKGMSDPTNGNGNLRIDPQVVNDPLRHIKPGSPVINVNDTEYADGFDIDGQPRRDGGGPDIGADESYGESRNDSIIYVSTTGNDSNDGRSWGTAKLTFGGANAIAQNGDEIWIASGIYVPTATVTVSKSIAVYGGFLGYETDRALADPVANVTVFDGNKQRRLLYTKNFSGLLTFDGLKFMNASTTTDGGVLLEDDGLSSAVVSFSRCTFEGNTARLGGAIANDGGRLRLDRCKFEKNTGTSGGAVLTWASVNEILNCSFTDNVASGDGGAVYVVAATVTVDGTTFSKNKALRCGGLITYDGSTSTIMRSQFISNESYELQVWGSALDFEEGIQSTVENCVFTTNTQADDGASVSFWSGTNGKIRNCVVQSALGPFGSGIHSNTNGLEISNCTVVGGNSLSAILISFYGSAAKLVNNIVAFTKGGIEASERPLLLNNCVWGNSSYDYKGFADPTGTDGNIRENPQLALDTNMHIQPNSPCREGGNNSYASGTDIDGQARIQGAKVDIGADESDGTNWGGGSGRTIFVSPLGSDSNDGLSWGTAKRTIAAAISIAQFADEIWVQKNDPATPYGGGLSINSSLSIFGGFAGNESSKSQRNIELNRTVITGNNNQRIIDIPSNGQFVVLDGLVFEKGSVNADGGAISNRAANLNIRYCEFSTNTAGANFSGGAVMSFAGAGPVSIEDSKFIDNQGGFGAAIYAQSNGITITRCAFQGNVQYYSGGFGSAIDIQNTSGATIQNCTFKANSSVQGTVSVRTPGAVSVTNSLFLDNTSGFGACVYVGFGNSSTAVAGCTMVGNGGGTGVFSDGSGASIHSGSATTKISNTLIAFNEAGVHLTAPAVNNNLLFGNRKHNYYGVADQTGINGNIKADPKLALDGLEHIQNDSPCRDAGSNVDASGLDIDGQARIQGLSTDIGADESTGQAYERPYIIEDFTVDPSRGRNNGGVVAGTPIESTNTAQTIWQGNFVDGSPKFVDASDDYGSANGQQVAFDSAFAPLGSNTYSVSAKIYPDSQSSDAGMGIGFWRQATAGDYREDGFMALAVALYGVPGNQHVYVAGTQPNGAFTVLLDAVDNGKTWDPQDPPVLKLIWDGATGRAKAFIDGNVIFDQVVPFDPAAVRFAGIVRAGNLGALAKVDQFRLNVSDTVDPTTSIVTGPGDGQVVCVDQVPFTWTGSDDKTPIDQLKYSTRFDGGPWSEFTSDTSTTLNGVADGPHTFEVRARDLDGNIDQSPAIRSFTIDTKPPTLSDVSASTTFTSATITWKTDEQATSQVEWGLTESYGNLTTKDNTLRTTHSVTINGLALGTVYHFRVRSSDGCGHEGMSIDQTFSTANDVTPPETTITVSPLNGLACGKPVHFEWKGTDDYSSSDMLTFSYRIDDGEWSEYKADTFVDFDGGLTEGPHTFEVRAKDEFGNIDASPAKVDFILDTTPPVISNMQAVVTEDDVEVTWDTDDPSTSQVDFRLNGGEWQSSTKDPSKVKKHTVKLTNLMPGNYTYRVRSENGCDKETVEGDGVFVISLPDLVVTHIVPPQAAQTDTAFFINWTEKNQGSAKANGPWTDSVYFSLDDKVGDDTLLSSFVFPIDLNAGQSIDREQAITVPSALVPEDGTYYLVVRTDSGDSVEEGPNDDNNAFIAPVQITKLPLADLTVSTIYAADNAQFGTDLYVDVDVRNIGQTSTDATAWFDRIALVQDGNILVTSDRLNLAYLEPGQAYRASFVIRIPKGVVGDCMIRSTADVGQVVRELSETNNVLEKPIRILPADAPDLECRNVAASEFVTHGQAMPISWLVRNVGETRTPPDESKWTDAVYLSVDNSLSGDDIYLEGVANKSSLLKDAEYQWVDRPVVVPHFVAPGKYYVIVRTDSGGSVFEFGREANNIAVSTNTVTVLGTSSDLWSEWLPDNPVLGIAGENVELKFKVTNDGPDETVGSWVDRIALSKDAAFDDDDTILYAATGSGLARDASYDRIQTVHLPLVEAGTYYLFAITDATDAVYEEGSETNNVSEPIAIEIKADAPNLITKDVANPNAARNGDQIRVNWTVKNIGIRSTNVNWDDRIYLSRDTVLSGEDINIGGFDRPRNLEPNEDYRRAELVTLPITAAGSYFVIVQCDAGHRVNENDQEADNIAVGGAIQIENLAPDLQIDAVTAPASVQLGEPFDVSWTGSNQGSTDILVGGWNDYIYLSDNDTLDGSDRFLGSKFRQAPLSVGGTYLSNGTVSLPFVAEGNYFLIVVADGGTSVFEGGSEGNNSRSRPIAVSMAKVDLVVDSVQTPSDAVSGQLMTLNWSIRNQGPEATRQAGWSDQVILSRDKVLDASDLRIGQVDHVGALGSNQSYNQPASLLVPYGLSGTYYAFLVTDANGHVPEMLENNNTGISAAIVISLPPPVDLEPRSATLPGSVELGVDATWTYEIENIGLNTATGSWTDTLYLSVDDKWDLEDTLLGRVEVSETVVPGGKYTKSLTAAVPAIEPGEYHLLIRANARNTLRESDRTNNDLAVNPKVIVSIESLNLGEPKQITLMQGRDRFYQTNAPANETLRYALDVNDPQSEASTELYVRSNGIVKRSLFEFGFDRPWEADQQVYIPSSSAGVYYSLFGVPFLVAPESATILAEIVPFSVRAASPTTVGDRGRFTIGIRGGKLDKLQSARIKLGGTVLEATSIQIVDRSTARLVFLADGLPLGQYDLEITADNGESKTSTALISVEPARVSIQVSWDSDKAPRQGRPDLTYAVVHNDGNIDWPYAQLRVMATNVTQLEVDGPAAKILAPDTVKGATATILGNEHAGTSRALAAIRDLAPGEGVPLTIRLREIGPDPFGLRIDIAPQEVDVRIAGFISQVEALRQAILLGAIKTSAELATLATDAQAFVAAARQSVIDAGYFKAADFAFSWPQGPAADLFWKVVAEDPNRVSSMLAIFQAAADTGVQGFGAELASQSGRGSLSAYQGPQTNKEPRPAIDPNGKGGSGAGQNRHYSRNKPLVYTIEFENVSTAQGTASRVELTDVLPPEIDPRSVTFLNVNFGKYEIQIPSNRSSYHTRIELGPELGNLLADISCFVDVPTSTVKIILQAIDPQTGEPPNSSLVGLLPPEDGTGRGRGSGSFQSKPKKGVVTSSVTDNQAKIRFDNEKDLDTNTFSTIVDSGAPISIATAGTPSGGAFRVSWSGQDDEGGIGIESYDVYVAEGDGAYKLWLAHTNLTTAVYEGKTGLLYRIYTRARDGVANLEAAPTQPDVVVDTSVGGPDPFRTPIISALDPSFVVEGAPSFTLIVKGRNFAGDAKVYWNGVSRPVSWVSSKELRVDISETLVEFPGFADIIVENPNNGNPKRTGAFRFEIRSK